MESDPTTKVPNANGLSFNGNGIGTFIPKKLAIIVGIVRRIVATVKIFMMEFTLLLIIEANASKVLLSVLL